MRRSHHMFLLEGVYFISFCTLYAYTVTILLEYGYTEVQCGYITMLPLEFTDRFWNNLIDRVMVYHDGRMVFRFKDGTEVMETL